VAFKRFSRGFLSPLSHLHCTLTLISTAPPAVNVLNLSPDVSNPKDPVSGFAAIPRNMTGMAEKMKLAGYVTHQVGKWDAGILQCSPVASGSHHGGISRAPAISMCLLVFAGEKRTWLPLRLHATCHATHDRNGDA